MAKKNKKDDVSALSFEQAIEDLTEIVNRIETGQVALAESLQQYEKGMAMIVTGFIPAPLGNVTEYTPTQPEIAITVGVYAIGFLVLTVLYKMVLNVRERLDVS